MNCTAAAGWRTGGMRFRSCGTALVLGAFGEAYVITVDSNLDLKAGGEQSAWLAKQLEGLPKGTKYVFVSLHHPPVADGILGNPSHDVRPNENALAQQLEAAAKQTSAKIMVIAGHIHSYERFERGGVVYLVSGGGGAKPYPVERSAGDLFQNPVFPIFHYVKFVSKDGALQATMYRWDEKGGFTAWTALWWVRRQRARQGRTGRTSLRERGHKRLRGNAGKIGCGLKSLGPHGRPGRCWGPFADVQDDRSKSTWLVAALGVTPSQKHTGSQSHI